MGLATAVRCMRWQVNKPQAAAVRCTCSLAGASVGGRSELVQVCSIPGCKSLDMDCKGKGCPCVSLLGICRPS
eukprot:scaffold90247_cov15-Tisochrysis_lutea.AAC.1